MRAIHSKDFDDAAGVGDLDGPHDLVEPLSFAAPAGYADLVEMLEAKLRDMPQAHQGHGLRYGKGYRDGFANGERFGFYQAVQELKRHIKV